MPSLLYLTELAMHSGACFGAAVHRGKALQIKVAHHQPGKSADVNGIVEKLLFLTFSVLVANPQKLLYTVASPARGLLNREKRTKEKRLAAYPPTLHIAHSEKK